MPTTQRPKRENDPIMTSGTANSSAPVRLAAKLGITGGVIFTVRHEPAEFADLLGDIGTAVWQRSLLAPIDVVVTFHRQRSTLLAEWPKLAAAAEPNGAVWVAWPKATSGVATDITEDVLRAVLSRTGWVDNKGCSIDEVWSGMRFVQRKVLRRPRDNKRRS